MASQLLHFFIFFVFFLQPATCQNCPACPTNGIWSDWTTTETCPTPCGACSTIRQNRTCLSTSIGCPCVGSATATVPCNTQACAVAQTNSQAKACCSGTSKLSNNLYYCIPPADPYVMPCCPTGGYWANWGVFVKAANKISWTRTRECISEKSNCPCTGDKTEIQTECPCLVPTGIPANDMTCQNQANLSLTNYTNAASVILLRPQVVVRPSRCEAYSMLEASPWVDNFTWSVGNNVTVSLIGNIDEKGVCSILYVTGGLLLDTGSLLRITYTCNLNTLRYETGSLTNIYKVGQFAVQY